MKFNYVPMLYQNWFSLPFLFPYVNFYKVPIFFARLFAEASQVDKEISMCEVEIYLRFRTHQLREVHAYRRYIGLYFKLLGQDTDQDNYFV